MVIYLAVVWLAFVAAERMAFQTSLQFQIYLEECHGEASQGNSEGSCVVQHPFLNFKPISRNPHGTPCGAEVPLLQSVPVSAWKQVVTATWWQVSTLFCVTWHWLAQCHQCAGYEMGAIIRAHCPCC